MSFVLEEIHNTTEYHGERYFADLLHRNASCEPSTNHSVDRIYKNIPLRVCADLCGLVRGGLFSFVRPKDLNGSCDDDHCDCQCYESTNGTDENSICKMIQRNDTNIYQAIQYNNSNNEQKDLFIKTD